MFPILKKDFIVMVLTIRFITYLLASLCIDCRNITLIRIYVLIKSKPCCYSGSLSTNNKT